MSRESAGDPRLVSALRRRCAALEARRDVHLQDRAARERKLAKVSEFLAISDGVSAALEALGAIGGPEASRSIRQMIVKGIVQGPNLAAALIAASRLGVKLNPDVALPLL